MVNGEADDTSHIDLGVGYKEMGLLDAAISEFRKVGDRATNAVYALTAMGECQMENGDLAEAVATFKKALNLPQVQDVESTQLYYLLGKAFVQLGDRNEALYFFNMVAKRSRAFRDVEAQLAELQSANRRFLGRWAYSGLVQGIWPVTVGVGAEVL